MLAAAATPFAPEPEAELDRVATVVVGDLCCCRTEKGSTGSDPFYGRKRKKKPPGKKGLTVKRPVRRTQVGTPERETESSNRAAKINYGWCGLKFCRNIIKNRISPSIIHFPVTVKLYVIE